MEDEALLLAGADALRGDASAPCRLKRALAHAMIRGSPDIDPSLLQRTPSGGLRMSLTRAGIALTRFLKSPEAAGLQKPAMKALLQSDPCFSLVAAPGDPATLFVVLHLSRLRAAGGGGGSGGAAVRGGRGGAGGGGGASTSGGGGGGGGSDAHPPETPEQMQLVAAADALWPRFGGHDSLVLNEITRQMVCAAPDLLPQRHLSRVGNRVTANLSQPGIALSKFFKRRPELGAWAAGGGKLRPLLEGAACYAVHADPGDQFNMRCTLDLDSLRLAAAAGAGADAPRAPPRAAAPPAAGCDPEWPHANNVDVGTAGLCRPVRWRAQLRGGVRHVSTQLSACRRCGFRGHVAGGCAVPRCGRCGRHGHGEAECGGECRRCGIAGGGAAGSERAQRNTHAVEECPFNQCHACGRVGHYTSECPGAPAAAAAPAPAPAPRAAAAPVGHAAPPAGPPSAAQISAQIEAIMDLLFEHAADLAIDLVGDMGVATLTAALSAGGGAFRAICAAAESGDAAAAKQLVDALAAAGRGRGGATPSAPAPRRAPPPPPEPLELASLCDAVWPPAAGPHALLKGAAAKELLGRRGGAGGWDGRYCWLPLGDAGPRLLAFWRDGQRLYAAPPGGAPPFSSLAAMLAGDPYLSCRARGGGSGGGAAGPSSGGGGGELCVVLDAERLSRWGASAPLPSFAGLLSLIDTAFDPQVAAAAAPAAPAAPPAAGGGKPDADTLAWGCAKLLAAAGNPGASPWEVGAAARVAVNDAAYAMLGSKLGEELRLLWAALPWVEATGAPYPAALQPAALLHGRRYITAQRDPVTLAVRYGLDLYGLVGCPRPAAGDDG
ncbi:MAG: hypothetical protein J3K34DRAFT_518187 [Monoraphidium minutum]|nr:MAG: hypothetical protein J3K34DRAFT_518187 [Monoraphidium minutum]